MTSDDARRISSFMRALTTILDDFQEAMWDGNPSDAPWLQDYYVNQPEMDKRSRTPQDLRLLYGGDGVAEAKIEEALSDDRWWIILALMLIMTMIWLYTHSCFIAVLSVAQTGLTWYSGLFVFIASRDEPVSILGLLGYFIILALSCDGVMIFFNTFRQTAFMETSGRRNTLNVPQRLAFTYRKAGISVTISHLCAGVAFICNAVSPVPAIKSFGVLMVILCCFNWYLFVTFFPCILIWHHFHISRRRRNAQRQKEVMLRRKNLRHSESLRSCIRDCDTAARVDNGMPSVYMKSPAHTSSFSGVLPGLDLGGDAEQAAGLGERRGSGALPTTLQRGTGADFTSRFQKDMQSLKQKFTGEKSGLPAPPPRRNSRAAEEEAAMAAAWDRVGGVAEQVSRRKQQRNSVLQIPVGMTCLSGEDPRIVTEMPPPRETGDEAEIGTPRFDREQALEDYAQKYRPQWQAWGCSLRLRGPRGPLPEDFADPLNPQPGRKLRAWYRIAQTAQVIHESAPAGPLRRLPYYVSFSSPTGDGGNAAGNGVAVHLSQDGGVASPTGTPGVQQPALENSPLRGQGPSGPPPPGRQQGPAPTTCCGASLDRLADWWEEKGRVKRRFGRFGKRVNETREEKDRRILGKRSKHEGFTWLERFFYNSYTPLIRAIFPYILLVTLVMFIVFASVFAKRLPVSKDTRVRLLADDRSVDFDEAQAEFPIRGPCDFCGAYFRPHQDFPPPFGRGSGDGTLTPHPNEQDNHDYWSLDACNWRMFFPMDSCGTCGGDNRCLDCMGQAQQCLARTQAACQATVLSNPDGSPSTCIWDSQRTQCRDPLRFCPGTNQSRMYMASWTLDSCGACYLPQLFDPDKGINWLGQLAYILPRNGSNCIAVAPPKFEHCGHCSLQWPRRGRPPGECSACLQRCTAAGGCSAGAANTYPPPKVWRSSGAGEPCTKHCNGHDPSDTVDCPPERGECEPYSGECVCHSDYVRGFWATPDRGPPCSECLAGFFPSPADLQAHPREFPNNTQACTLECVPNSTTDACIPDSSDISKRCHLCDECTVLVHKQSGPQPDKVSLNRQGEFTVSDLACCAACKANTRCRFWERHQDNIEGRYGLCRLYRNVDTERLYPAGGADGGDVNSGIVLRECDPSGQRRAQSSCACKCTWRNMTGVLHPDCRCSQCLGPTGDLGPRPIHPEAVRREGDELVVTSSVAVGMHCQSVQRSLCLHGTVNATTGACTCDPDWEDGGPDGGGCKLHRACYYHGVPAQPVPRFHETAFRIDLDDNIRGFSDYECHCYGCWTGRFCNISKCLNGGRCQDATYSSDPLSWECDCVGVWEGTDCSVCPDTCQSQGNCPVPWPESVFDGSTWSKQPPVEAHFYTCWGCIGHWGGDRCDVCTPPSGVPDFLLNSVNCTPDGKILGCDGQDATETQFKWRDNCGMCRGMDEPLASLCVGCDGQPGSQKLMDACGVCGGHTTDPCACEGRSVELEIVWGLKPDYRYRDDRPSRGLIYGPVGGVGASMLYPVDTNFDFSDDSTQSHLHWVCSQLNDRPDLVVREQSECIMDKWRHYLFTHALVLDTTPPTEETAVARDVNSFISFDTNCSTQEWVYDLTLMGPDLTEGGVVPLRQGLSLAEAAQECRGMCCDNQACVGWTVRDGMCMLKADDPLNLQAAERQGAASGSRYADGLPICTWVHVGPYIPLDRPTGSKQVFMDVGDAFPCPQKLVWRDLRRRTPMGDFVSYSPESFGAEEWMVEQEGRLITVTRVDADNVGAGWFMDMNFMCCAAETKAPTTAAAGETDAAPAGAGRKLYPVRVAPCISVGCADLPGKLSPTEVVEPLAFPLGARVKPYVYYVLHQFAEDNGLMDHIGFTTPDPNSQQLYHEVLWLRMRFSTLHKRAVINKDQKHSEYKFWERIMVNINIPHWAQPGQYPHIGSAFQWSETWVELFTELQAEQGAAYAIGMAAVAFVVITLLFTCSPLLTLLACMSVSCVVIFTTGTMYIAGWTLGPAEQVGLSVLMGLAVEYTVHITEGYLEYLQATQSTLLAVRTTREQAIAGTLQRTGVPIMVSAVTMMLASCVILACKILVYKRIAEIMIINVLFSSFHGLVVFAALIMAAGPTTVQRTWYARTTFLAVIGGFAAFTIVILYLSAEATDPQGDPLFE
eukprot:TRINITY_DN16677_c0_g1_i1.p1 TRINITY_DN16677_c0_g1~~TRINITY_DN16677_c0_g1_i1.p1  ORF type:complete len:2507 (+),score=806.94 TRINITY_DN16677_c0_g1_i1:1085-7522(+)